LRLNERLGTAEGASSTTPACRLLLKVKVGDRPTLNERNDERLSMKVGPPLGATDDGPLPTVTAG
jgi:hypothetical protein